MTLRIKLPDKNQINEFCRRNHIRKLAFFGSVLRDDFGPDSDIDILVEFHEGKIPGFFSLMRMQKELSDLFEHQVDLRTANDLSSYFRNEVIEKAEVYYSAG